MNYRLRITGPAQRDVIENHRWWAEERSLEQADRWLNGIDVAISSLRHSPQLHGYAPEKDLAAEGLRQMLFGLGRRPSHRVVYVIDQEEVVVLRVRSVAQDVLGARDLSR